ncbi:hypothetical protein D3C78_706000 [compost metagenome]
MDRAGLDAADLEGLAVVEQVVELAAVGGEFGLDVEQLAEGVLYHCDVVADGQGAAELFLEVVAGAEVVGVHVGFEDPLYRQAMFAHVGNQLVGAVVRGTSGGGIVVQHRIDQGALAAVRIAHHVAVGEGGRIEEGFNMGVHGTVLRAWLDTRRGISFLKPTANFGSMHRINSYIQRRPISWPFSVDQDAGRRGLQGVWGEGGDVKGSSGAPGVLVYAPDEQPTE